MHERPSQKQERNSGEVPYKTRFLLSTHIHCFLQKMLGTTATFTSRDATQPVRFPSHLPLSLQHQWMMKITPNSLPGRAATPKTAPGLLREIFYISGEHLSLFPSRELEPSILT